MQIRRSRYGLGVGILLVATAALANDVPHNRVRALVEQEYPALFELYCDLHAHPELSFQEVKTSARLAGALRTAGLEVAESVGGHGVVGIKRNGPGPTLLLRSDLDALPVEEKTGLPYASRVRATDDQGQEVFVMHACGHDAHISVLVGAARLLTRLTNEWRGTLVFVGQPAEERGAGAKAMLADGLFERFPKPDFAFALHVRSDLPAGMLGQTSGPALANVDSVDIVVRGLGGHGSAPHTTKDPIVLAAQLVLALQTIVSREIQPGDPAVVTVGSIHGGTKHNIIPDEVQLQLTLRSYSQEARAKTLAAIRRIARGLGEAAGLPEDLLPVVRVGVESLPAVVNDPALTARLANTLKDWFGKDAVIDLKPSMGGEDFGLFGGTPHKVPVTLFWLGAANPAKLKQAERGNESIPSPHSPRFAPDIEPTLKTGVITMVAVVMDLAAPPAR